MPSAGMLMHSILYSVASNRDPFTARSLGLRSDDSGKHDVVAMIHKVEVICLHDLRTWLSHSYLVLFISVRAKLTIRIFTLPRIIFLQNQICFSREVDLDSNEESSDTTGRYTYLLNCRKNKVRPCVPAAMQVLLH